MYIANDLIDAFDENNIKYIYKELEENDGYNCKYDFLFEETIISKKRLITYNLSKLIHASFNASLINRKTPGLHYYVYYDTSSSAQGIIRSYIVAEPEYDKEEIGNYKTLINRYNQEN